MSRNVHGIISETMAEVDARIAEDDRQSRLDGMEAAPDAPESLRERLAAAFAEEDEAARLGGPLGWLETQRTMPDGGAYYRRLADRAIRILTESALR